MAVETRIALITGGAAGIGAAIARRFARQEIRVAVGDVDREQGEKLAAELGGISRFYDLDVGDEEAVIRTVDRIVEDNGRIDILVNNAGITNDKLLIRMSKADWDRVLEVNLTGAFLVTRAVVRHMMKQRYGRIVNVASIIGIIGNIGQANYAASKAGIIALTKSCAKELASRNINVNAVAPGFIRTRMTDAIPDDIRQNYLKFIPLNRFGEPKDVAELVLFLASEQASYITGQTICIDGGMVMH
ncbi:3-oxoacyl-[acyl-carrier-protein] reductase [candidate division WOR-3 bacterium]|nr:3-oxoacyl-[acyl-carrier-protein] reductase [candidate division WOR-3 bacterium]